MLNYLIYMNTSYIYIICILCNIYKHSIDYYLSHYHILYHLYCIIYIFYKNGNIIKYLFIKIKQNSDYIAPDTLYKLLGWFMCFENVSDLKVVCSPILHKTHNILSDYLFFFSVKALADILVRREDSFSPVFSTRLNRCPCLADNNAWELSNSTMLPFSSTWKEGCRWSETTIHLNDNDLNS